MIQENELRIGNWVLNVSWAWHENMFFKWNKEHFALMQTYGSSQTKVEGISITPIILKRANANQSKHRDLTMWWILDLGSNIGQIHINTGEGIGRGTVWLKHHRNENTLLNPHSLLYVHELQNLYFTLTGEELKIDL